MFFEVSRQVGVGCPVRRLNRKESVSRSNLEDGDGSKLSLSFQLLLESYLACKLLTVDQSVGDVERWIVNVLVCFWQFTQFLKDALVDVSNEPLVLSIDCSLCKSPQKA